MRFLTFLCVFAMLTLQGCGKSMPSCTDSENTELLKQILDEHLAEANYFVNGNAQHQIVSTEVKLTGILPQSIDDKIGKVTCKGTMEVSLPERFGNAKESADVEYNIQFTADTKQRYAEVSGLNDLIGQVRGDIQKTLNDEAKRAQELEQAKRMAEEKQRADAAKKAEDCEAAIAKFVFVASASGECGYKAIGFDGNTKGPVECVKTIGDEEYNKKFTSTLTGAKEQIQEKGHDTWCADALKTGLFEQPSIQITQPAAAPQSVGQGVSANAVMPSSSPQPELPQDTSTNTSISSSAPAPKVTNHPSFDCKNASKPSELTICSDGELAAADRNLAKAYRAAIQTSADPHSVRQEQDVWMTRRDDCGSNTKCLAKSYATREAELRATASVPSADNSSAPSEPESVVTPESRAEPESSSSAPAANWQFSRGQYSVTMTSADGTIVQLWKNCDAHSPQEGAGHWSWNRDGWSIELDGKQFAKFANATPPYPDDTACKSQ